MKLVIFDGNSIINRAFYGIRLLSNREGVYTNAVYGFLNIYLKFMEELHPDCVCVAFDRKEPTFRHEQFEGYKAQRTGMPQELASQLPLLKEVLTAMRVSMLELPHYEADDIIGTVSRICAEQNVECDIITGDKDDLQLIGPQVRVQLITTRMGQTTTTVMDEAAFREKYGMEPARMVDLKALMGDSSDNIPGVPGIGEKTAMKLLAKYGSLDALYEEYKAGGETAGVKKKLTEGKESAFLSYQLATIDCHAPMEFTPEQAKVQEYDLPALRALLERLELKTLAARMCGESQQAAQPVRQVQWQVLSGAEGLPLPEGELYFTLYDGGCGFAIGGQVTLVKKDSPAYVPTLRALWSGERRRIVHDCKAVLVELARQGVKAGPCAFDCMIGAYLADPSRTSYDLSVLAGLYAGKEVPYDRKKGMDEAYAAGGLDAMPAIAEKLMAEIEANHQHTLYYDIEHPLCEVLADMELRGFPVDKQVLVQLGGELAEKIARMEQEIYDLAGEHFNINSPKQLGVILFEKMGLPVIKKTKTGYSTDVDVMNKLSRLHPIAAAIVEYRQYTKLKSTYVDGLLGVIGKDGRIHSSFNQTITQTGRLSSTEPNLQNIPVRLEYGREIRRMFVPESADCVLVDADYSQIELRVLASIAEDETMIEAFQKGVDIHALTASTAFRVPLSEVTPQMRGAAKAVNFGIVYGIGEFSLSEDLHISRREARHYIDSYLSTYHGVREYMENIVKQAQEQGYVTTLLGRRRYIPEINSKNHNIREFGKRCAMNTPIQGSAADIIKIAMVGVHRELKCRGLRSYLVLQVHDELIVNAYQDEVEQVQEILRDQMEHACNLKVKLEVDMHTGESWYSAKG